MKNYLKFGNDKFELYLSEQKIAKRIKALAGQINKDYKGKVPIFIGILNGSFIFMADLIRNITVDCEVDFLKLSSYGDAKISSGHVTLLKDLNATIGGRDIIVVEDIVDSGLSINFIKKLILLHKPKTFKVVSLLYKKEAIKIKVKIDYIGFTIPSDFVIGYGLDYLQKERNLKGIYRLVMEKK
ncbi:MAG: hypoxanthine phosphoribosyltransferase [Ignavibacteriales bacterium]|nr:hypoxanthine phosphoribosyltransferase [Ignavibacteriales bacterium]